MQIRVDDLRGPEIIALLREHMRCMEAVSPPESRHALNLDGLRQPEITFWTIWQDSNLAGCGALKQLSPHHGEIKSMRTTAAFLRQGVASRMLTHILNEAQRRSYHRVSLETGSTPYFEPARKLYANFGFKLCDPFADYKLDPNSVFMTKEL